MKYNLLSIIEDPPPGFEFRTALSQRDLRLRAFALFADSVETAESHLKSLIGKVAGLIVTYADVINWSQRAPLLYHLGIPRHLNCYIKELLPFFLELLDTLQGKQYTIQEQLLELARSLEDRQRLADDFALSRKSLIQEIAERKAAEEALRESEEKYRLVVENASDAIFIIQDGLVKFPNKSLLSVSGYSVEELERTHFQNFIHPEDRNMVIEMNIKRLRGESVPGAYSFRILKKSGETVWTETSVVLITWEGRPATLNFIRDITRQKKLEEQLLHAQKMEAVGTLAGGIAHDFNNLLMGILGYTSLMLLHTEKTDYHYEKLKRIERQVESGADLTKQLLGFARGGKYQVKPTNLNELIKESSDMFVRTKKEIVIHRKLQDGLCRVEADRGQIEQALINLYVNAWQAMPAGGDLYIETRNIILDEAYGNLYEMKPGAYVKIKVTDTGIGMDEATQKRIFDPFFTTKEMGMGTGLGLASAYGIIKNHGGIITVYSEKGHGASFSIYLPASEKEAAEQTRREEKLIRGNETILLVDDEKINLDVVSELLETLGYKVLTAQGGREAVEISRSNRKDIHLTILDMIMPGMSGSETFERLKEINPGIKVILSSGYSINGEAEKILERGCRGFIQKPFYVNELSRKIREALDG